MRTCLSLTFILISTAVAVSFAEDKTPPVRMIFHTKQGDVVYYHYLHARRVDNDCKACHTGVFQQDAKAPLNYADHAAAEARHASCATCHYPGGRSFGSKNNCDITCHAPKT